MRLPGRAVCLLAGTGCGAVAFFACWVSGANFLLLVDRTVVRPQVAALLVWSVAVLSSVGLLVLTLVRHEGRLARRTGDLRLVVCGAILAVTLIGSGTWCTASAVVAGGVDALGVHAYTVLPAADDRGCTLIAHEIGVLRSSSGRLYSADGFGLAKPVGSWRADEIQLPVRNGEYSLRWRNGVGTLSFRTTRSVAPERLEVTCH